MMLRVHHFAAASAGLAFTAAPALAQVYGCVPGVAFGVQEYRCADCGSARYSDSTHTVYSFGAEPVVVAVLEGSQVRPGDYVVAVNGHPITTRAGADHFSYPPPGTQTITVRRRGAHVSLRVPSTRTWLDCDDVPNTRVESFTHRSGMRGGDMLAPPTALELLRLQPNSADFLDAMAARDSLLTVKVIAPGSRDTVLGVLRLSVRGRDTSYVVELLSGIPGSVANNTGTDIRIAETTTTVALDWYGVLLTCPGRCVRALSRSGRLFWRFNAPPTVTFAQASDPASDLALRVRRGNAAGLRTGDVITMVNGKSTTSEEGAMLLSNAEQNYPLTIEFLRDGRPGQLTLKGRTE